MCLFFHQVTRGLVARFLQRSKRNLSLSSDHPGSGGQGPKRRSIAEGTAAYNLPSEQVRQDQSQPLCKPVTSTFTSLSGLANPVERHSRTSQPSSQPPPAPWTPPFPQWQSPQLSPWQLGTRGDALAQLRRFKFLFRRITSNVADTPTWVIGGSVLRVYTLRWRSMKEGWKRHMRDDQEKQTWMDTFYPWGV